MNKNQRKNKIFRSDFVTRSKLAHELSSVSKNKTVTGVKVPKNVERLMVNRCCLVHPKQKDFGQSAKLCNETVVVPQNDRYTTVLSEQYGFDPIQTKNITEVRQGKNVLCGQELKVENCSQYDYPIGLPRAKFVETADGTQWQNIDSIKDVDRYIQATIHRESRTPIQYRRKPLSIHISDVPKVKIIVEKFSKFKRHNVELRRLDEKVVCVEYDVYDYGSTGTMDVPIQTMRAFFSVKPAHDDPECDSLPLTELPATIKHKFNILDEDLKRLTVKEIEIIDDSIENNKCYLDDLRRILRRQQFITAKGKSSIDLKTLYEMARRENELLYNEFMNRDIFSKSELTDLKNLIMQRCNSSVHGISRRRIRSAEETKFGEGILSRSIMSELLRFENTARQN